MAMNQRRTEKWAVTRAKGRGRYIWLVWVLSWGLITGVLWSIFMGALQGWDQLPFLFPIAMIIFPIGGYYCGAWMWNKLEVEYHKTVTKPPSD
jgi:hypothetical protein